MEKKLIFASFTLLLLLLLSTSIISQNITSAQKIEIKNTGEKHYALIIGVDSGDQWISLTAEDFHDAIDTEYWDEIRLIKGVESTKANILDGIDWLTSKSSPVGNTVLLFFYSGHSGTSYLETSNDVIYDDDLKREFSSINSITTKLVMIFETCFAGRMDYNTFYKKPLTDLFLRIKEKIQSAFPRLFTVFDNIIDENPLGMYGGLEKSGRVILASSKAEEKSCKYEGENGYSKSVFANFLIEAIDKGYSTAESIFSYAKPLTMDYVESNYPAGTTQTPQIYDNIDGNVRIV